MCPYIPKHQKGNKLMNEQNKLGHYIYRRICKDQLLFKQTKPRNHHGLYIQPYDIQRYISDYSNYGMDYTGDDNLSAEDLLDGKYQYDGDGQPLDGKHFADGFHEGNYKIDQYWDEPEGHEK